MGVRTTVVGLYDPEARTLPGSGFLPGLQGVQTPDNTRHACTDTEDVSVPARMSYGEPNPPRDTKEHESWQIPWEPGR